MHARSTPLALRALTLGYFAMGASALAVIGALPDIAHGMGIGTQAVAGLVSIYALVFAVTAPLLQVVAARVPRRSLILGGLVLSALGALGSALAHGYATLFAARVLVALGGAAIGPVASALGAGLVAREEQARALATVFSGMTLASVVSTPAAEWLAAHLGWRAMFMTVAVLNVAVAASVLAWVKDRTAGQPLLPRSLFAELARPAVASGVAVMFLYMTGMFASFTMVVPLLAQRFGLSGQWLSAALLAFGVAGILGNALAMRLGSRWSADRLLVLSMAALIAIFVGLAALPGRAALAFAALVLWAVSNDVFMPSQQRRLAELAPQARGLVLALNSSALYVGMSAGSLLSGAVSARAGTATLPVASAGVLALALVALAVSRQAGRARGAAQAAC